MTINEKLADVLNDLIQINNDRVTGYERAADEAKNVDVDLIATFNKMADDSRRYVAELSKEVRNLGEMPADGTTNSGKLYRVWMDVKNTFTNRDRQSILESCEYGEDVAQKAYETALSSDAEMSADVRQLITEQKSSLKTAHDLIKKYRDLHKQVS
ncbi:MAG: PA2169 family four-helix-bundle protein [Bacteroidota bacterium]